MTSGIAHRLRQARLRAEAARAVRRPGLRWWLVWGPVRSGTTLMADLVAEHARWEISDWGLAAALTAPQSPYPASYDPARARRAVLAEALASCRRPHGGVVDLVYKQANLREPELEALTSVLGPPERSIFCLREPAAFMRSATRKFPDVDLDNLRRYNYVGTLAELERLGGEVFLYHPEVTGAEYAAFLEPLPISAAAQASVRYTGSAAPDLVTDEMKEAYERVVGRAANLARA